MWAGHIPIFLCVCVGGQREIEELTEFSMAVNCKYSIVHILSSFFPRTDRRPAEM